MKNTGINIVTKTSEKNKIIFKTENENELTHNKHQTTPTRNNPGQNVQKPAFVLCECRSKEFFFW